MALPRYATIFSPNEDGSWSKTKLLAGEIADYLANRPVESIYFADDFGHKRHDTMTVDEATTCSQQKLNALFGTWLVLRAIMGRHESTLNKRWLKKTVIHRKAILYEVANEVAQDLPPMHRPDLAILRNKHSARKTDFAGKVMAMRFPQFNIEDLSQPKPLLLMFDSRSRNFPSLFANTDLKTLQVGIKTLRFVPRYIRGYTMYLNGQHTWETYGRIVSWEEDPNAITKYWQGVAPDPGLGILILDNQRTVLHFLASYCLNILHDIPLDDLFKQSPNSIPPPLPGWKTKYARICWQTIMGHSQYIYWKPLTGLLTPLVMVD
ncbi:MAG: hypothetical protein Q9221_000728 [Calogaya cf. arnoldii]